MGLRDEIEQIRLDDLTPDPRNPRFPRDQRAKRADKDQLFIQLANNFDALSLAESIAHHGYFASEPMIVTEEGDEWIVLEGNRRLTALYGLARSDLRAKFDDVDLWDAAAEQAGVGFDFPVPAIVADAREDADAVIGFRHIGSVLEWKPVQRAQFLAYLVDERGESFMDAAETVGEEEPVVRLLYRNQAIIVSASEMGEQDVAAKAMKRFGIFTTALNRTSLREYIGAKVVAEVEEKAPQLDRDALPNLVELSSWLFGSNGDPKVIDESRHIKQLAAVVADEEALTELQRTRDLDGAFALISQGVEPGPKKAMRSLAYGVGHIRSAALSIELIAAEPRAAELAEELAELTEEIQEAVESAEE